VQQPEVAAYLATAQQDAVRLQGLGQLRRGPGAVLAQEVAEQPEDAVAPHGVGGRAGSVGGEGGRAASLEVVEDLADGLGVAAQVGGDARR
jgi:hypothetical protein